MHKSLLAAGLLLAFCGLSQSYVYEEELLYDYFPDGFAWGVATASYQIEGGWDEDGKSKSIWDVFADPKLGNIDDDSDGKVACDSYHKYKEDVQLIKNMGLNSYRFSIAWTRIIPDGVGEVNMKGVQYYKNLIAELKANDIMPLATLYHWDLPQVLQDVGGWENRTIADAFEAYARACFENFGDDVKHWLTFNEPWVATVQGYGDGGHAPGVQGIGTSVYQAAHNIIRSHGKAFRMYEKEFKPTQGGQVAITLNVDMGLAANETDPADLDAAENYMQFNLGWFANPIYGDTGDYPEVMKTKIAAKSALQGYNVSRLPEFTAAEKEMLKGSYDFIGINSYTSKLIQPNDNLPIKPPSYYNDDDTTDSQDETWYPAGSSWLRVFPYGMRALMNWVKDHYGDVPIYITENGYSDRIGNLDDQQRIYFYKHYINNVLKSIKEDNVNVIGYFAWSLLDNFEWARGYTEKFGLHNVNMSDPERARTPKASSKYIARLARDNGMFEYSDEGRCNSATSTVVSSLVIVSVGLVSFFLAH